MSELNNVEDFKGDSSKIVCVDVPAELLNFDFLNTCICPQLPPIAQIGHFLQ